MKFFRVINKWAIIITLFGGAGLVAANNISKDRAHHNSFTPEKGFKLLVEIGAKQFLNQTTITPNGLLGKININGIVGDSTYSPRRWNEFASTLPGQFKHRKLYAVVINYTVKKSYEGTTFYLVHQNESTPIDDRPIQKFKRSAGDRGQFVSEFRANDNNNSFQLKLGIKGRGKILITGFQIWEGAEKSEEQLNNHIALDPSKGRIIWSDEFEGGELNNSKWQSKGPIARRDGVWHPDNAYLDGNGNLVLETNKKNGEYRSGAIRSKADFLYGYFEAKVKLNKQKGHWVAFWLFDEQVHRLGDLGKDGTEIDIFESPWRDKEVINQALHWDSYGEHHKVEKNTVAVPDLNENWHTFGLDWSEHGYVFFVNGKEVWRTDAGDVSRVPLHIKITDEIANWSGEGGDISQTTLPDKAMFDYVRVYETESSAKAR